MGQRRELLEWMEKGHCNWRLWILSLETSKRQCLSTLYF
jgi:hypothetical protein